jgi:hypothetical protein
METWLRKSWPDLLLEQIIESLPCVFGFASSGRSFAFDTFLRFKKRALIARILSQDARGDWLSAFKANGRIEKGALLAGVKVRFALGTLTVELNLEGHDRAAQSAAKHLMKAGHRPGTEFLGPLWLWSVFGSFRLVSVHVTVLPIFPFHKRVSLFVNRKSPKVKKGKETERLNVKRI